MKPLPLSVVARAAWLATALLLAPAVHAATDAQFQPAFEQFNRAAAGDTAAIEPAAQAFADLLKAEPTHPVLLAYAGAATSMRANTTWLPWKKMGYAEDGLAQLDKALGLLQPAHNASLQRGTPGVLEVKFVAANTFLAVPGFMNRKDKGLKLLNDVLASPLLAQSPVEFQKAVADAASRAGLGAGQRTGGAQ
ncbi:hypothetical protein [Hydrogenophaga soli]